MVDQTYAPVADPNAPLPPGALSPSGDAAAPSLRMAKRYATFNLPAPYDMYTVTAWVNYPAAKLRAETTEEGRLAFLCQIVKEHNIHDFDDNLYPPASDPEFWRQLPDDVAAALMTGVNAQVGNFQATNATR